MEDKINKPEYVTEKFDMESSFIQENEKDKTPTTIIPNIRTEQIESEHETAQQIPNVVQSEDSVPELESSQEKDETKADDVCELDATSEEKTKDSTPKKAGNIEVSGWKRLASLKAGQLKGGGQSLPVDDNQIAVSKSPNGNLSQRKESLGIPTKSAEPTEGRRESTVSVSKASKFSVLSPLSRRSIPFKTDFTTVQMPNDEKNSSLLMQEDSWIRVAIPYLPLWVAVVCLLLNILVAGTGTIISGLCILCCGKTRVPPKFDQDPVLLVCVNTWVGLAQLFTVTFMLVGWFWSVAWGIRMIILSLEHRREIREQRATQLKAKAVHAFGQGLARK